MKIGILTFHYAHNFGAMLQAFALKKYLERAGYHVSFIDYRNENIVRTYPKNIWRQLHKKWIAQPRDWKKLFYEIEKLRSSTTQWRVRWELFHDFMCRELIDRLSNKNDDLFDCYDIIFFGSDQIWEKNITNGYDPYYFGRFKTHAIKASYGASCYSIQEDMDETVLSALDSFQYLSVRESSLADYLTAYLKRKVICVCDPVFLLDEKVYSEIMCEQEAEGYILFYYVSDHPILREIAKKVRNKMEYKVIEVGSYRVDQMDPIRIDIGPREFLGLVKGARYVFTNSFHGTAFSIIFKKDFTSVGGGMRIKDLLDKVGLESRYAQTVLTAMEQMEIAVQYEKIEKKKQDYIKGSLNYIAAVLKDEEYYHG